MPEDADPELGVLLHRWLGGDRGVFDAIISATEGELRAFAMSRTSRVADAEEAVQTAYVVAFERLAGLQSPASFLPWLKGIAKNRLHELHRAALRDRHDALDQTLDQAWEATAQQLGEEGLRRRLGALQPCLERLDARLRSMLELHHLDGLGLNELAQRFRRPRAAIAKILCLVRSRLRDCIERGQDGAHA